MKSVRGKFEEFLLSLGATYVADNRGKVTGGAETKIPCITVGFPAKVAAAALQSEAEFWKLFALFQKNKELGPKVKLVKEVVDSLGHTMRVVPVMIPRMLDGVQTDIIEHPIIDIPPLQIKPVTGPAEHMKKFRPVPGGVSLIACGSSACSSHLWVRGDPTHAAHKDCWGSKWYGTVEYAGRRYTGCWHIGQNYHCVMQFSTDGSPYPAGHGMAQPSPYDGGVCPEDVVATRHTFIIQVTGDKMNDFDYMIGNAADLSYVCPEVLDFGGVSVVYMAPEVGWEGWSSSRTEGTTKGPIKATDVTIMVNYQFFYAYIKNCIQHGAKISGGSSGSSFLSRPPGGTIGLAGINFAGSSTENYAIALPAIARDYGLEFDWAAHPDDGTVPPTISMSPTTLKTGDTYTLKGTGFTPNGQATTAAMQTEPDGTICSRDSVQVDDKGSFSVEYTMKCSSDGYCVAVDDSTGVESNHVPFKIGEEDGEPPDCWGDFLEWLMTWDGSNQQELIEHIVGLIMCLLMQGQALSGWQKKQILGLISPRVGRMKALEIMDLAGIALEEKDYRGLFALGTLLGCGVFGALSIWYSGALPIFTFFNGLTTAAVLYYFGGKAKQ